MSINNITLVGRVGKFDPKVKTFQDGNKIVEFSLVTSESWRDRNSGEKKTVSQWHSIKVTGGAAKIVELYVNAGNEIAVTGSLVYEKWEDKQSGQKREKAKIEVKAMNGSISLIGGRSGGSGESSGGGSSNQSQQNSGQTDFDDEIPF